MLNGNSGIPVTMNVSPTGSGNCNGGFGWGDGAWWIIILLIFAWGGFGNGYGYGGGNGSTSVYEGYVLNNDMSQLSRQIDNASDRLFSQNVQISNGLCDGFYAQAQLVNGVNTNIMTVGNAIQTQMADCCCKTQKDIKDTQYVIGSNAAEINRGVERGFADTNYNIATQANGITNAIQTGFCQTNFNAHTNTRDIVDSQNAGTRAILDKLCQMESNAKDEKIAELTAKNSDLRLAASQAAQNNYLLSELKPCPSPAYVVPNPYCNCNCNNGCM